MHHETDTSKLRWDTRTRTKNDRTRICSVTITPYPIRQQQQSLIAELWLQR